MSRPPPPRLPAPVGQTLLSARFLPALLQVARDAHLTDFLATPVSRMLVELPPMLAALLRSIDPGLADWRMEEFLASPRVVGRIKGQASPSQRRLLLDALVRHACEATPGPDRVGTSSEEEDRDRRAPDGLPADVRGWERWLRAHGLSDLVDETGWALQEALWEGNPRAFYAAANRRLVELAASGGRSGSARAQPELEQLARTYLVERRDRLQANLQHERLVLGFPPPDAPRLADLVRSLRQRHASVARANPPGWHWDDHDALSFHQSPDRFTYRAEEERVTVRLPTGPGGDANVTCTCRHATDAGCAHARAALVQVIGFLTVPPRDDAGRRVLDLLCQPGWARALNALRELAAPGEPDMRLAVRLCPETAWAEAYVQKRGKHGWTRGRRVSWDRVEEELELTEGDRRLVQAMRLEALAPGSGLSALVGYPRVSFRAAPDQAVEVRRGQLGLSVEEGPEGLRLTPTVNGRAVPPERFAQWSARQQGGETLLVHEQGENHCAIVPFGPTERGLIGHLGAFTDALPAEAGEALMEALPDLERLTPVHLPPSLRGERIPPDTRTVLRLEPGPGAELSLAVSLGVRPVPEGPFLAPGEGGTEVVGRREGARVHAVRDLDDEAARARALASALGLGPATEEGPWAHRLADPDAALALVAALDGRHDVQVEWPRDALQVRRASLSQLRIGLARRKDWFGLEGAIEIDGHTLALAAVLQAVREGRRFVAVSPGRFVELADELRARLEVAAHLAHEGRQGLEVSGPAALLLDDLAEDVARFDAPDDWFAMVRRVREASTAPADLPDRLDAQLRPYQEEGYRWLRRLESWQAGGILADDMGLGKTVQAIALLLARAQEEPALVVAPTSVCGNWARELARFAPGLQVVLHRELPPDAREEAVERLAPGSVLITSYGLLARDAALAGRTWGTLILDEAQAIKNPATRRARAARELSAGLAVALTGTPIENHLGELWSILRVVFPALLGSLERFRARFALPIEKGDTRRQRALAQLIAPFVLRRTKAQVATDLPARTEIDVPVALSAGERALYEQARLAALAHLTGALPEDKRRFEVLAALTRLRLLACHPRLHDPRSHLGSAKLDRFLEVVDELREEGHRALVFSQFTKHLALVREALDARDIPYTYLDGRTPAAQRQQRVDAFQDGELPLFLISLKAGGTGLNLTGADYVIHLDPWWNPAVEDQATDRAHRIGQVRPVTVLRLIAAGTVEEQILSLHAEKRALIAGLLGGSGGAALDPEAILALLSASALEDDAADDPADAPEQRDADLVPSQEVPRPEPSGTAGVWTDVFDRWLADRGGHLTDSAVRNYRRVMGRFEAWAEGRTETELAALAETFLDDVSSGRVEAPKSTYVVARAVLRHLVAFAGSDATAHGPSGPGSSRAG